MRAVTSLAAIFVRLHPHNVVGQSCQRPLSVRERQTDRSCQAFACGAAPLLTSGDRMVPSFHFIPLSRSAVISLTHTIPRFVTVSLWAAERASRVEDSSDLQ